MQTYQFDLPIQRVDDVDGASVVIPLNLPKTFGMGRMKVRAQFDGVPYRGSIVSMGQGDSKQTSPKKPSATVQAEKQYVLGITQAIRQQIGKQPGDIVHVSFVSAQIDEPAWIYVSALLTKVLRKGRTEDEFAAVISWLLGYERQSLTETVLTDIPYAQWLDNAPQLNPAADAIKGKVCGYAVTDISDETMRRMRLLDKVIDELAKGKPLESVCR